MVAIFNLLLNNNINNVDNIQILFKNIFINHFWFLIICLIFCIFINPLSLMFDLIERFKNDKGK